MGGGELGGQVEEWRVEAPELDGVAKSPFQGYNISVFSLNSFLTGETHQEGRNRGQIRDPLWCLPQENGEEN